QRSTNAQDSTVLILTPEGNFCSGTLIAQNLVLTARHCVAEQTGDGCGTYGPTAAPNTRAIFVGIDTAATGAPNAVGARITVPKVANICSFDVALIELDRPLQLPVATVRFTALQKNEPTVAVGYGRDGFGQLPNQRLQRQTTVLAV